MGNAKSDTTKGIIYGGIAGLLWGTLGVSITLLLGMGLSDVAVSSIGPMIIILFYGIKTFVKNKKAFYMDWKDAALLFVGGGIANAVLFYSYSKALGYLSTGVFSILEFSHVFILMLLTSFIFKYKITKGKLASLALAVIGLTLVLNVFTPDLFIDPIGIGWMVLNWIANCCIALIIKWALNKGIENDVVITYYNLGAALIYWVVCPPWEAVSQVMAAEDVGKLILVIAIYGILTQIISSYVWVKSFSLVDPAITNMMNAFAPITASILGYLLFGQTVSISQVIGIIIVIGAVYILNKVDEKDEVEVQL